MKVGIMGAGAMGCLLGASLADGRNEIWLVDVWEEHVRKLRKSGLTVSEGEADRTVPCNATTSPEAVGPCGLVIISTKFHDTESATRGALPLITPDTIVLTVQNGIGNVEIISQHVDPGRIVFGLTTLGSVLRGPGWIEVTFSQGAETHVWTLKGEPTGEMRQFVGALNKSGLQIRLSSDVEERIWKKVCLNAGFSVLTAITQLSCGDLISQTASLSLIRGLIQEICHVAEKEGVKIDAEESYRYVVNLAHEAPQHKTSFLMDVIRHRKTEIDSLNGAIIEKAEKHHLAVPHNKTISNLVRIIENTYKERIVD